MPTDIFHSEPARGARIIDCTGPNASVTVDLTTSGSGHHFRFTIKNSEVEFIPPTAIEGPRKLGKDDLHSLIAIVSVQE